MPNPRPALANAVAVNPLLGILFVAICADFQALRVPTELNTVLWQAHYYRKAVEPVIIMQLLVGVLFAGGIVNYGTALVDLFRFKLPQRRVVVDALGVGPSS